MSTHAKTIPFTHDAFKKLQTEHERLQKELELVKERVKVAREMGDLSENGAYHYGKFELGNISRQLRQVQHQLKNGYVVAKTTHSVVDFGATVTLEAEGKQITYMIVSLYEADPRAGKISDESPIGKAVLGKKVKDTVTVLLPRGEITYTIVQIA